MSTIEKYYGELLSNVTRSPAACKGVLLVTTTHELPVDAFQRITEVTDVVRTEAAVRDGDPERVADF